MEVALKSARRRYRGCDDLKAGVQVMAQFVRIHMVSHRVADAIGQKSDPKLAQDGWQIVVLVRAVKQNIVPPLDQRFELSLRLRGADGVDRSENVNWSHR